MAWKEYKVEGRTFHDYTEALDYASEIADRRTGDIAPGPERWARYSENHPEIEELGVYYKIRDALINVVSLVVVAVAFAIVVTMCTPRWMFD